MMTRKYYALIAEAIRGTIMSDVARLTLINRLSYQFKGDNPNFDRAKFRDAATPTK